MILSLAALIIILIFFTLDSYRYGFLISLAKPFWVFSYFFMLSYPIKYLIIINGYEIQAPLTPDFYYLNCALLFSCVLWIVVRVSYSLPLKINFFSGKVIQKKLIQDRVFSSNNDLLISMLVGLLMLLSLNYYYVMFSSVGFELVRVYHGNEQIEARVGNGFAFLIGDLYLAGLFLYLFGVERKRQLVNLFFGLLVFGLAFLSSILLSSRRPLYIVIYLYFLYHYLNNKSFKLLTMLALFPFITSLLAPFSQLFRYSFKELLETGDLSVNFSEMVISIGSTYEGVEYLSRFLEIVSTRELIGGVDLGVSYAFNALLALLPRTIWSTKPLVYGSVEIQDYLYSTGYGVTTLPSGVVVDALYGFGLIGFIFYAIALALLLRWMEKGLYGKGNFTFIKIAIMSYFYIYMFNIVRGGTGVIQGLVMLLPWLIIVKLIKKVKLLHK
ncbi:O-antigen polymerase [Endozoicomonas sp. YOMI1]|uniref:O-antigen polymerase n=1 Tax=Endozoicomonas sp. YOMI1 TaxID=2828739 RepID=UPI0021473F19|nr:O-antigen polymerase [Endozoicomonas sp. YOMI1]